MFPCANISDVQIQLAVERLYHIVFRGNEWKKNVEIFSQQYSLTHIHTKTFLLLLFDEEKFAPWIQWFSRWEITVFFIIFFISGASLWQYVRTYLSKILQNRTREFHLFLVFPIFINKIKIRNGNWLFDKKKLLHKHNFESLSKFKHKS